MPTHRACRAVRLLSGCLLAVLLLSASNRATAQPGLDHNLPTPVLNSILPSGGKIGSAVEVTFAGANTEEPDKLVFSHPGIKAEAVPPPPPDPKAPPNTPKPTVTKFKVTIEANVPPGHYDVRLVNKWGVSNPRVFTVGDLNEVQEKEPNNDVAEAQRVELESTVNGVISAPTDVDYYVFAGKKGQRVVVSCLTSTIDSRSQAGLEVYDAKGKMLASNRNYRDGDALTDVTLPADGDYFVRVFEFTYTTGSADHFYRLSISTSPWIDAIHPSVVEPGKPTKVTIYGRNLPGGQLDPNAKEDGRTLEKLVVTVTPPADAASIGRLNYHGLLRPSAASVDGFEYRLKNAVGSSNPFLLTYARAPVVLDNEQARTAETPQAITVPCEIAGRVEKKRDRDWYVFEAKAGQVLNIEVFSERLGAPTAMYLVVQNAQTKAAIFESPDNPDIVSAKFYARTDDPAPYRFTAPADGKYLLLVASRFADTIAGPRHLYRVRITPDQPDFRLVVTPAAQYRQDAPLLYQGGHCVLEVFAWRRDGFAGDIALTVEGLPPGVTATPQTLAGPLRHTLLVLSATDAAALWTGEIKVKGTAKVGTQTIVHEARPGGVVWQVQPQQNIPALARLDQSLWLAVRDKAPFTIALTADKTTIVQGDKAVLTFKATRLWPDVKQPIAVQTVFQGQQVPLPFLPPNATLAPPQLNLAPGTDTGTTTLTVPANVPPGTYTIAFYGQTIVPYNKDPKAGQKPNTNIVQPTAAVSITVLPKTVANVTLAANNVNAKVGSEAEVLVKVQRQFGYEGEFKVQLVIPQGVTGVSAADVVIPAGKDEVKLMIKVNADAAAGPRANLIVRATAMYNGTVPTVQDSPALTVTVTK
jgi:hypothetical protein